MSQSLNHCVAVLRHPSQSESYNICSQPKAAGAWCVAHLTANVCASPSRWQSECICSRWCCGAVLSWKLAELFQYSIWKVLNTYTYFKLIFNGFPFSTCYKGLYCSANTPVGTCCCVIRGWGGLQATQRGLTQVFVTAQFSKQSKPEVSEARRFKALGLASAY